MYTLSDKISANKTAEISTWCREFLSAENFVRRNYKVYHFDKSKQDYALKFSKFWTHRTVILLINFLTISASSSSPIRTSSSSFLEEALLLPTLLFFFCTDFLRLLLLGYAFGFSMYSTHADSFTSLCSKPRQQYRKYLKWF